EASEVEDTNNKTNDEEQNIAVAPVPVADIEDEVDQAVSSQVAPTTPEIVPTVSEIFPDTTAPETLPHDEISPEPIQDLNAEPVADDVPRPVEDVSEENPKPSSDPVETIPTENEANDTNNKDVLDGTKEDLESESLNPTEKTEPNDEQQENRPVTSSSPAPAEEALISFDGDEGQMLNSEEMQRSSADGEAIKSTENADATPDVVTEDAIPLDDNGNIDESLKTTLHEPTARFVNTRPASDALTVDDEPVISNSADLKQIPNGSAQGVEVPP
uniref:Uncharacterized protein n=1 Tax=Ciona savignyi TaxID=51511 RepID=H2Z432_CIOSA